MEIPKNVTILSVERVGQIDRFGQPVTNIVYNQRHARLERVHRLVRDSGGDTINIDAVLYADDMDLIARDLLVLDNPNKDSYRVFDVSEENDVDGTILFRLARLVKQR